jgi:hypothetical protein
MKNRPQIVQKKDHTVVVPNFFGEGENLEVHQLGWQLDDKLEAKSSVSKKIFNNYIADMGLNMVFYYVDDNHWYGIHNEMCPFPFFRFIPKESMIYPHDQMPCDTHTYGKNDILQWFDCGSSAWDEIKINGKSLEEVLQRSYILVS